MEVPFTNIFYLKVLFPPRRPLLGGDPSRLLKFRPLLTKPSREITQ